MNHDIGDVVVLTVVFRNEAGAQTAPTTVTLTVKAPDGTREVPTHAAAQVGQEALAEAATGETLSGVTGVYRAEVEATMAGRYRYAWVGTGAIGEAIRTGDFYVRRDNVGEVES